MLVPVAIVGCVAVAIVDVIHVVIVRDGNVAAVWAMLVLVRFVRPVLVGLALIPVSVVLAVQVAVVHVINVIFVWNGDVTAVWAVLVGVIFVDCVSHFSDILSASFSVHFH